MYQESLFSRTVRLVPPWLADQEIFTVEERRQDLQHQLSCW